MRADSAGFGLVEALVALVLLMVILAGACRLASLNLKTSAAADRMTYAAHLASAKLGELETRSDLKPGWYVDAANPIAVNGQTFARYWSVTAAAGGLNAEVFVSYTDEARSLTLEARSPQDLASGPCLGFKTFIAAQ